MNMSPETYKKYADARAPKSPIVRDCTHAFLVGGLICAGAQGLVQLYTQACGLSKDDAGLLASATLVLVTVVLTGLGVFDRIARFAGAGTLIPITGFANAVVSPAIDSHSEGLILGVGAKIFSVAGPVLLYGTLAGSAWGVVYYIVTLVQKAM